MTKISSARVFIAVVAVSFLATIAAWLSYRQTVAAVPIAVTAPSAAPSIETPGSKRPLDSAFQAAMERDAKQAPISR